MKIYLDNCCFNRPFDDQCQIRVRLESEAKLEVQARILHKELDLVWSYILDFENQANPFEERREAIEKWRLRAVIDIEETPGILAKANEFMLQGLRPKDALHLACATEAACDVLLTTDDAMLHFGKGRTAVQVMNPVDFIVGENHEY
ncbi:MAG: PIN domain-containing protein [bacterium]